MVRLLTFSLLALATIVNAQDTLRPRVEPRSLEVRVYDLINAERVRQKRTPLKMDLKLSEIARHHSEDMARRGFFDHVNPDGNGPTERGLAGHYQCTKHLSKYSSVDEFGNIFEGEYIANGLAENIFQNNLYNRVVIAGGKITHDWNSAEKIARTTVDGWMNSPGHRQNILTPRYEKTGVGIAIAQNDTVLITQVFC